MTWWWDSEKLRGSKVVLCHPDGTWISEPNFMEIQLIVVEISHSEPNMSTWRWQKKKSQDINKVCSIHPLGTMNIGTKNLMEINPHIATPKALPVAMQQCIFQQLSSRLHLCFPWSPRCLQSAQNNKIIGQGLCPLHEPMAGQAWAAAGTVSGNIGFNLGKYFIISSRLQTSVKSQKAGCNPVLESSYKNKNKYPLGLHWEH